MFCFTILLAALQSAVIGLGERKTPFSREKLFAQFAGIPLSTLGLTTGTASLFES